MEVPVRIPSFTWLAPSALTLGALLSACNPSAPSIETTERSVYSLANGCFALSVRTSNGERYLAPTPDGLAFAFNARGLPAATPFHARAADLGTYVFRDAEGAYPVVETGALARTATVYSDTLVNNDAYVAPSEWELEVAPNDPTRFRLHNRASDLWLGKKGPVSDAAQAANVAMSETAGCAPFPELSIDATGSVVRTHWDDGALFGTVDAHSHLFTNFGFGGGGTFHGSPFHRLGVEHALPSCELFHGFEGRRDILDYFYTGGDLTIEDATMAVLSGEIDEFNHHTAGYPDFTDWPNSWRSNTHQMQYYKWIERAWLSGLRLIVQDATSNQVLCELVTGVHAQERRISCNEMVAAERSIDETYALERYIDAQSGGPGLGWFRVVTSPAEARTVIGSGKLAVVLGIETSNLFDCFVTPREGFPACDDARVRERLDHFQERGVRVLFPVHKFDNGFSAGDGNRGFIEFGSVLNSGHYTNFTTDCPGSPAPFDQGSLTFGDLNMPRAVYDAPPPIDVTNFGVSPLGVLFSVVDYIESPPLVGNYCQNHGLTAIGETLINEMMRRGMILEIDHLPQRSYERAVEMLVENDYPAAGTHGSTANGTLYALGGISTLGLPRCGNPSDPLAGSNSVQAKIAAIVAQGGYPAQGFAFDLNGFAGGPRPRFGADAPCSGAQTNPVTYPFTSYAGDVVFDQPELGNRTVDFNTEGMIHLGLLPEYIEDARHLGVTDADLEPVFRSAEGYIRMWELAETRAAAIRAAGP